MFVRLMMPYDVPAVCALAKMNWAETMSHCEWDDERCTATFTKASSSSNPTVFVVEDKREVIAFLLCTYAEYRAFAGLFTCQEVLFVRPDKRGSRAAVLLMKNLVEWSKRLGAREIIGGNDNSFKSDRTAKFLEHFGFKRVGYAMRRTV